MKEILFSYTQTADRFHAQCAVINDGVIWGEEKALTNDEVEGLSSVVDFDKIVKSTFGYHRFTIEELEPCFETTELDDTNFATMYHRFAKENN